MTCLRRVQGLKRMDRVRNEAVREALRQEADGNSEGEAKEVEGKTGTNE